MAKLTLKKLQYLWEREKNQPGSVVDTSSEIYNRAQEIFNAYGDLLELFSGKGDSIFQNSNEEEWGKPINIGHDDGGYKSVYEKYAKQAGEEESPRRMVLDLVCKICPSISERPPKKFAIMSGMQKDDCENENAGNDFMALPRAYFLSYNPPARVAEYLLKDKTVTWEWICPDGSTKDVQKRFPMKYLWMLKTTDVIPILSLQSFYNLEQVFIDLDKNFKQNFEFFHNSDNWAQTLNDFSDISNNDKGWKKISDQLCKNLNINDLAAVIDSGKSHDSDSAATSTMRQKFAEFLFYVSLADNIAKDAQTMLEHGNHAIILYGPPGTGKTYRAKQIACQMLGIKFDPDNEPEWTIEKGKSGWGYNGDTNNGMYQVVQFHPNYAYQDFVGGIFPDTSDKGGITYQKKDGIFKKLCEVAKSEENKDKKFILIIDEINRANLSAVFGELMYGLEYREKAIDIPVFGTFSIPKNLYIIGTMNNTDKSLIGFDLALRRRFGFIKIMPDMNVLNSLSLDHKDILIDRATDLNNALKRDLDLSEDKQIGHAYFMKITDFAEFKPKEQKDGAENRQENSNGKEPQGTYILDTYALEQLWDYHISPLLEEYLGMEFEEKQGKINDLKRVFIAPLQ